MALTRARKKVFLLTQKGNESVFAQELISQYEDKMRQEQYSCPLCGAPLARKKGAYGEFYGCTNYGKTGCRYTRKIQTFSRNGDDRQTNPGKQ